MNTHTFFVQMGRLTFGNVVSNFKINILCVKGNGKQSNLSTCLPMSQYLLYDLCLTLSESVNFAANIQDLI